MITTIAAYLAEKKKNAGKPVNEDFGSQPEGEAPIQSQPSSGVEETPAQPENELASKFEELANASVEYFGAQAENPIDIKMFADFGLTEDDFKMNTYDLLVILKGKDLCVNSFNEESIELVKVTSAEVQVQTQPEEGSQPVQAQETQPEVQESLDIYGDQNEAFSLSNMANNIKNAVKGIETFNLLNYKPSQDAIDFYDTRKNDLVPQYNKFFITKQGMTEEQAKNAIMALYDFGKGQPLLKKYTLDFDKTANTLKVDPNGKGLFNGSPIMG